MSTSLKDIEFSGRVRWERLQGQLGGIVYEMTKVQFAQFNPSESWQPAINAYRCADSIAICVELAGVDKSAIDLQVEPRRVLLRGKRPPPEPEGAGRKLVQVLEMEIDYGLFEREILLPSEVDQSGVTAEQLHGLLWVYLPLRAQA
jgi:HSP20 family molecular chaperone IbpA